MTADQLLCFRTVNTVVLYEFRICGYSKGQLQNELWNALGVRVPLLQKLCWSSVSKSLNNFSFVIKEAVS